MKFLNSFSDEDFIKLQRIAVVILLSFSLILLLLSFGALASAWYHAFHDGRVPDVWGTFEGNHGPWKHYYPGRALLYFAIVFQAYSLLCSILSLLFKWTRNGILATIITTLLLIVLISTHYWLID